MQGSRESLQPMWKTESLGSIGGKRRGTLRNGVKALDVEIVYLEDSEELYVVSDVSAVRLDHSQLATLRLESGNCLRFQTDIGTRCNVVPVHLCRKGASDRASQACEVAHISLWWIATSSRWIGHLTRVWLDS